MAEVKGEKQPGKVAAVIAAVTKAAHKQMAKEAAGLTAAEQRVFHKRFTQEFPALPEAAAKASRASPTAKAPPAKPKPLRV